MLAGVNEGVWSGLNLVDIGPRSGINICQNQVHTFAILGATAAQTRHPIASNISQKCLTSDHSKRLPGVRFVYRGMSSTFDLGGLSTKDSLV